MQLEHVYNKDFYLDQFAGSERAAQVAVPKILELVPGVNSVVDVGCGTGIWLHHFKLRGVKNVLGLDGGNLLEGTLQISTNEFMHVDLSAPIALEQKFDLAVSLEVAEHLPAKQAPSFVKSLVKLSDVVVFSAAIPGQGGTNHINERWLSYWDSIFEDEGYRCFDVLRSKLWFDQRVEWWYSQNTVLFVNTKRTDLIETLSALEAKTPKQLDIVHPRCFEQLRYRPENLPVAPPPDQELLKNYMRLSLSSAHVLRAFLWLITFRLARKRKKLRRQWFPIAAEKHSPPKAWNKKVMIKQADSFKPACVTDYRYLYCTNYYAHEPGHASFDLTKVPEIVTEAAEDSRAVLDVGGGNGILASLLLPKGIKTVTIDASAQEAENFIRFDLSRFDADTCQSVRRALYSRLGENYFTTCFDVAEHIDIEHLDSFLLNLSRLVALNGLISISVRPSSAANRFHATILPIETWIRLLELAGFDVEMHAAANEARFACKHDGMDENIIAVAHWQRLNPFRERHLSHQHYLFLHNKGGAKIAEANFRRACREILDLDYRTAKRQTIDRGASPILIYNVNFIQDWSFARSIMDVWPSDRIRLLIRRDTIATPYVDLMRGMLDRTGTLHKAFDTVEDASAALGLGDLKVPLW